MNDLGIGNQGERKKGETRMKNKEFGFSKKKTASQELGFEEISEDEGFKSLITSRASHVMVNRFNKRSNP